MKRMRKNGWSILCAFWVLLASIPFAPLVSAVDRGCETVRTYTAQTFTSTSENGTPDWENTVSLMPSAASDFEKAEEDYGGGGHITVTPQGGGYRFVSDQGWPSAYYNHETQGLYVHEQDDLYLNYDIEVVSGGTNVMVYFAGQNPSEMASPGTFVCINGLVDPSYVMSDGNALMDLPIGRYVGSVSVRDLGYREDLKDEEGNMLFSGCRIYAVGGEVIVHGLGIGAKEQKIVGDMSGDGTLNMMDALLLFGGINGARELTDEQKAAADYNGDGVLNMMDALLLFKHVSGQ